MRIRRLVPVVLLALVASFLVVGANVEAATAPPTNPVPSLEPAKTEALWRSLVAQQPKAAREQAACRPLRAVFYAASDWLRLATKLAAARSSCADYYISVPPLVADKTQFRRDQASRIRALGPNFHAMAEVHFTTWSRWVASTGSSWFTAGVTAREHMAAAGYDVAQGDTWALNELTTAVRRGDGNARANVREFLRGLYEGDGSRPTRGDVLIVGFGQRTSDLTAYQNTLQNWLADTAFWTDMGTYVSDWSQEVYGDLRAHAVPGAATSVRREYLNDYLQHPLVLANAGPTAIEAARSFLQAAYSPLANAAWPRDSALGLDDGSGRSDGRVHLRPGRRDALLQRHDRAATRSLGVRLGAEEHDRTTDLGLRDADRPAPRPARGRDARFRRGDRPGDRNGACGPPGADTLCNVDIDGASHNGAWRSFRTWTQPLLTIAPPTETVAAGAPSAPSTVSLTTAAGTPATTGPPLAVTLRSSSSRGTFGTSSAGPWTPTLTLSVAPGVAGTFYYRDTLAGSFTVTASATGATAGTQAVTVTAGPAARLTVTPDSRTVKARATATFKAAATDAFGNVVPTKLVWRVTPPDLGRIAPIADGATFTAGRVLGTGRVIARAGAVAANAAVSVSPGHLRIASLKVAPTANGLRALVGVTDGARRPISKAKLTLAVTARRPHPQGARGHGQRRQGALPPPNRVGLLPRLRRHRPSTGLRVERSCPAAQRLPALATRRRREGTRATPSASRAR